MDSPLLWIVVAAAFGLGEMLTTGFFLAPFAAGALLAALLTALGAGSVVAGVTFIGAALLSLLLLRPVAVRHLRTPPQIRTGSAALIGKAATVLERISNSEAVGCVRIDGEVWTARAYDETSIIEAGEHVQVVEIRGATALVMQ
ncbi:MAG: NfeD family protein [Solirubrobacteraceae bacterium]